MTEDLKKIERSALIEFFILGTAIIGFTGIIVIMLFLDIGIPLLPLDHSIPEYSLYVLGKVIGFLIGALTVIIIAASTGYAESLWQYRKALKEVKNENLHVR